MDVQTISIYIAIISAVISLGSLLFNWWSTIRAMEPHISPSAVKSATQYAYSIDNKGGGPALITMVEYYVNQINLPKDAFEKELSTVVNGLGIPNSKSLTTLGNNSVVGAGESIQLLAITCLVNHATYIQQLDDAIKLRVVIQYKSVHGKKKTFDSDD